MKGLFWKRELPPAAAAKVDFIWLSDGDMDLARFNLSAALRQMAATNVTLAQPRVDSAFPGGRSTDYIALRAKRHGEAVDWPPNCLMVQVDHMEVQTPIFRASAWSYTHHHLLSRIPDAVLRKTVVGMPRIWCKMLEVRFGTPPCGLLKESIRHLNTHTIERYLIPREARNASLLLPFMLELLAPDWGGNWSEVVTDAYKKPRGPCLTTQQETDAWAWRDTTGDGRVGVA